MCEDFIEREGRQNKIIEHQRAILNGCVTDSIVEMRMADQRAQTPGAIQKAIPMD